MSTTPSGQDDSQMEYFKDGNKWFIRLITNKKREYHIDEDAVSYCRDIFERAVREENYGNGRFVRNLLEQAIIRQSSRVMEEAAGRKLSKEEICILKRSDFKELTCTGVKQSSVMGFTA